MTDAPPLHILILAAGAASRMRGADKLLEAVDGAPLLRRIAAAALATRCTVWVTLPPDRPLRSVALEGLKARIIPVNDAASGLSASLRAGLARIPPQAAVMLLLADLPEIDENDLIQMAQAQAAYPQDILRATTIDGKPGHPVIFPPTMRAALAEVSGDDGARAVLKAHQPHIRTVPLPGRHAVTDLDTPEDWADWRARTGR